MTAIGLSVPSSVACMKSNWGDVSEAATGAVSRTRHLSTWVTAPLPYRNFRTECQ